jgi:ABC-2 type transport system ATP-binding protein
MVEQPSIRAESLVVEKGHDQILKGLSFSVLPGSITGLIGPSGSGKTTLMRVIAGVQKIQSGTLEVLGDKAGSGMLRRNLGYMSQNVAIYSDLTVVQNMRYFGALVGATRKQVDAVIAQVHLEDHRRSLVKNLSGGQQARVSLGVALLGDPELLILDEPTVGLDPLLRRELWDMFGELAAKGKTLLISSHVMDEAERCQNLLLLRDGKLLWHDSKELLLQKTGARSVDDAFIQMVTTKEVNDVSR